ncbi:phosphoethanolamine transferase domain-containing protein, partial [Bradyrhizobium sp. 25ACV]
VAKPVLIVLVLCAAGASYFIANYGVVIDKAMMQNVFETDTREACELLNWHMVFSIGLLGLLPAWLIARADIGFPQGL